MDFVQIFNRFTIANIVQPQVVYIVRELTYDWCTFSRYIVVDTVPQTIQTHIVHIVQDK